MVKGQFAADSAAMLTGDFTAFDLWMFKLQPSDVYEKRASEAIFLLVSRI